MKHVVEEAYACAYFYYLRAGLLCGVVGSGAVRFRICIDFVPERRGLEGWEFAAIQVESDLDFGFIGFAI
jgi:hypothetical protein